MGAPLFLANTHRHDLYRTFKFQVLIDGKPVAGLNKISALKKTTEAVDWRTGGDPTHVRKLPGGAKYEPVTLEQGLTHDPVDVGTTNVVGIQTIKLEHEGWVRDEAVTEPTES